MTQEEKAKAYDEALKVIKSNLDTLNEITETGVKTVNIQSIKNCFYRAFPQLKESENERIRKALIDYFDDANKVDENPLQNYGVYTDKVIAWLEKQKTNEIINRDEFAQGVLIGAAINLITWIDYNLAEGNMCLSNMECKDIEDALVHADWNKIYAYLKKKLEKQSEKPQGKSALDAINEEKVDNANKVEPKFKIGDWVVQEHIRVFKIIEICKSWYEVIDAKNNNRSISFNKEYMCHLWNIQDAKDRDILVSYSNQPFIYNGKFTESSVGAYCGLDVYGIFVAGEGECNWTCNKNIKPATKEQCDILFTRMKESGYKLDKDFNVIKI